jgi:hypothetical protein
MIPVPIKEELRSVFVGLRAAACLCKTEIRNGFTQEAAWGLAPAGASATASPITVTERLHFQSANSSMVPPAYPMTLLQELQAMLQARSGSGLQKPFEEPTPTTKWTQAEQFSRPVVDVEAALDAQETRPAETEPAPGH